MPAVEGVGDEILEALHGATLPCMVTSLHRVLFARNLLPEGVPSRPMCWGSESSSEWRAAGLEVAHTLLSLCVYPAEAGPGVLAAAALSRDAAAGQLAVGGHAQSPSPTPPILPSNTNLGHRTQDKSGNVTSRDCCGVGGARRSPRNGAETPDARSREGRGGAKARAHCKHVHLSPKYRRASHNSVSVHEMEDLEESRHTIHLAGRTQSHSDYSDSEGEDEVRPMRRRGKNDIKHMKWSRTAAMLENSLNFHLEQDQEELREEHRHLDQVIARRQDEERSSQLLVKHSRRMRKLQNHSEKWLQFQVIGQMASRLVGGITHKPTPSLEPGGERLTVSGKSLDQPSHVSQGASSQDNPAKRMWSALSGLTHGVPEQSTLVAASGASEHRSEKHGPGDSAGASDSLKSEGIPAQRVWEAVGPDSKKSFSRSECSDEVSRLRVASQTMKGQEPDSVMWASAIEEGDSKLAIDSSPHPDEDAVDPWDQDSDGTRLRGSVSRLERADSWTNHENQAMGAFNLLVVADEVRRKRALRALVLEVQHETETTRRMSEMPPHWWNMHPHDLNHQVWEAVMAVALIFTLLVQPFRICFTPPGFDYPDIGWFVEWAVNIVFIADMAVNCITGIYVSVAVAENYDQPKRGEEGKAFISYQITVAYQWVSAFAPGSSYFQSSVNNKQNNDNSDDSDDESLLGNEMDGVSGDLLNDQEVLTYRSDLIFRNYLRGWFTIDLLSILPWEYMMMGITLVFGYSNSSISAAPRLLKLFRLTRLFKLIRMHRLVKMVSKLQAIFPATVLELMKLTLASSVMVHYLSCGFYFIAVMDDKNGNGTWLQHYLDTHDPVAEHGGTLGVFELYCITMYWGFTTITTVGYGDIVPKTMFERMYTIVVMYCGIAMMSVITGKLTTILGQIIAQRARIESQLQAVATYCRYRNLPLPLKRSVQEYFSVRCAQRAICDEEQILKDMSPSLKAQVVCYIFRNIIESVPFFRGCSDLFLSAVLCCMEPILFAPADIIIQKGQRELAMYILAKGRAAVLDPQGQLLKQVRDGEFFGEIGLFFGVRRTATIFSITFCDTFKLMQDSFLEVQEMYPDMKIRIDDQTEEMFNNSIECYICGQAGHVSVQCKSNMKPRANEALSRSKKLQARREVVERLADVWLQKSGLSSHKLRSQLERTSTLNINNADCVVAVGTTEDTQNSLGRLATAKRQENAKEFEIREEESIDDMDVLPQYKPRSSSEREPLSSSQSISNMDTHLKITGDHDVGINSLNMPTSPLGLMLAQETSQSRQLSNPTNAAPTSENLLNCDMAAELRDLDSGKLSHSG